MNKIKYTILLTLFILCLFPAMKICAKENVDQDIITLDEITSRASNFDSSKLGEITKWDKNSNVFIVEYESGAAAITKDVTFKGTLKNPGTTLDVSVRRAYGGRFVGPPDSVSEVIYNGNEYEFTFMSSAKNANNPAIIFVTANYNGEKYKYLFVISTTNKAKVGTKIKRSSNDEIIEESIITSSTSPILNMFSIDNQTDNISIFCEREATKTTAINSKGWLFDSEIYVRVNDEDYFRIDASGTRKGENWSKNISLQEGINIVEICAEKPTSNNNIKLMNSQTDFYSEGITYPAEAIDSYITYIIQKDEVEGETIPQSGDNSLKYIEATQLSDTNSVPLTQYSTGVDEETGNIYIVIPETIPEANNSKYDKLILGLIPGNPNSTVEIKNDDDLNYTICGDKVGMYQAVKYTNADGTVKGAIKVKVIAQNGTEKTHSIYLKQVSGDLSSCNITLHNATIKDYTTKDETVFAPDKTFYQYKPNGTVTASISVPEGGKVYVDRKKASLNDEGTFDIDTSKLATIIKIEAADGVSSAKYYFVKEDEDGTVALDGQNNVTKEQAELMLSGWNNRNDELKKNLTDDYMNYWDVFMSAATKVDLTGATAYDVGSHTMEFESDWAGCILELVMIGENPYDYNGVNYVEGLKTCEESNSFSGPIWELLAYRVCGEPVEDVLIEKVLRYAKSTMISDDVRPWAIAALTGLISKEDQIALTLDMKETQNETSGLWGNAYTNGCYLSAIGASNVNIDYFDVDSGSVLASFAERYMTDDYKFIYAGEADSYVKDAIIGLGDLLYGRSVYLDYELTNDKLAALIEEAKSIDLSNADEGRKTALTNAITQAEAVTGDETGFGDEYYALYKAMGAVDDSYNMHVRQCSWEESLKVDGIIEQINDLSEVTLDSADTIAAIRKAFAELSSDKVKGYVNNYGEFEKAEEVFVNAVEEAIDALPDEITLDNKDAVEKTQKAFDILTDEEKQAIGDEKISKLEQASAKIAEMDNSPEETPNTEPSKQETLPIKKGTSFKVGKNRYKVTKVTKKTGTVTFTKPVKKTYKTISIPGTVKYKGYTFKVTAIAKNACKNNKKVKTVTIGKNVQTIGAYAFAGDAKLKKIAVKSVVLKKVGAKALMGINKKTVIKVPKKQLKKYTKLFKGKGQKKTVKVKK